MRQLLKLQTLSWVLYAAALFIIYQLIVKIAFLDYSWVALLLFMPLLLLGFLLPRREERRRVVVFTIAFLLMDRSLTRLDESSLATLIISATVVIVALSLLAKWYGRLAWNAIFALALVAVLTNFTFARDNLAALNHFYIKWKSERLYTGEWVDYFPITLYDVNHDGKMEVVTYGNYEERQAEVDRQKEAENSEEDKQALAEKLVRLHPEPLELYVFTWQKGEMVRIPNKQIALEDVARINEQMPPDYPGFPYYTFTGNELTPTVERQSYIEAMMQTGTAPFRAFLLDMYNIDEILKQNKGLTDQHLTFAKQTLFSDLAIRDGVLTGTYNGMRFSTRIKATEILDTMRLPNGQEGVIVLGQEVQVLQVENNGAVNVAYSLTSQQMNGLATSELIVADIDGDAQDELLVANAPSYILRPSATPGEWTILWVSDKHDKSFRFYEFAKVGNAAQPELIAGAKSWVSSHFTRYLTGFTYSPDGLTQQWKIYLPLMNVKVGDLDGDNENEIIASIYNSHRILVFKRHDLPVWPLAIVLLVGLVVYGVVRRFRRVTHS